MAKEYPLKIENWGGDYYVVGSKGHHDPDLFMAKVFAEGYDWPLGKPVHKYFKVVPDSTGEFGHIFADVEEGTRGSFPVTVSYESYGVDQYQHKTH